MTKILIGTLAKKMNCPVETIRYYEKIGLLTAPSRTAGGQRVYNDQQVRELSFVLEARKLDFSLETISTLLHLSQEPDSPCKSTLEIVESKLDVVNRKIADYVLLKESLSSLAESCRNTCGTQGQDDCCILDIMKKSDD